MSRHLSSLRSMERDCGWIHTLLEEAENERMHLMIAMCLRNPSFMIRLSVLLAQGGFLTWYTLMYAISSKYCHRFVGYLEEEAFKTYTSLVEDLDAGELPGFKGIAPSSVQKYYRLGEQGTLRDVFLAMRAGNVLNFDRFFYWILNFGPHMSALQMKIIIAKSITHLQMLDAKA